MAQFDFGNLESPLSGTVFINGNLEPWRDALHSSHKGGTRPSYAVEGMLWVNDTTNPWVLNMFDGANDIALGSFDTTTNTFTPSGVSQAAEDISFDNTDSGLTATNVQDAIDEAVSDFSDFEGRAEGFATAAQGAKADTALQPNGNGSGLSGVLKSVSIASVVTTSGTTVDITGVSNAKELTIHFYDVSLSANSNILIQLINGSGAVNSGYSATSGATSSGGSAVANSTTGFSIPTSGSGNFVRGSITLHLVDETTHRWSIGGVLSSSALVYYTIDGFVNLTTALSGVRLASFNGSDTFDSGSFSVTYKQQG